MQGTYRLEFLCELSTPVTTLSSCQLVPLPPDPSLLFFLRRQLWASAKKIQSDLSKAFLYVCEDLTAMQRKKA